MPRFGTKQYAEYSRRRPQGMGEIIEIGKDAILRTIKVRQVRAKSCERQKSFSLRDGGEQL